MQVKRIENDVLICSQINSHIQEIFIKKDSLLNDYLEHVILEKDIKPEYGSRIDKLIREMTIETKNLTKAHASNWFCDNRTTEIDIKLLTKSIIEMNYEKLLLEMRSYNESIINRRIRK
jgi:hypothetical protein